MSMVCVQLLSESPQSHTCTYVVSQAHSPIRQEGRSTAILVKCMCSGTHHTVCTNQIQVHSHMTIKLCNYSLADQHTVKTHITTGCSNGCGGHYDRFIMRQARLQKRVGHMQRSQLAHKPLVCENVVHLEHSLVLKCFQAQQEQKLVIFSPCLQCISFWNGNVTSFQDESMMLLQTMIILQHRYICN